MFSLFKKKYKYQEFFTIKNGETILGHGVYSEKHDIIVYFPIDMFTALVAEGNVRFLNVTNTGVQPFFDKSSRKLLKKMGGSEFFLKNYWDLDANYQYEDMENIARGFSFCNICFGVPQAVFGQVLYSVSILCRWESRDILMESRTDKEIVSLMDVPVDVKLSDELSERGLKDKTLCVLVGYVNTEWVSNRQKPNFTYNASIVNWYLQNAEEVPRPEMDASLKILQMVANT